MGQNPQKQDSVIGGTHKNRRYLLDIFNNQKRGTLFRPPSRARDVRPLGRYCGTGTTPLSVINMKKAPNRQPFSSVRSFTAALQQLLQPLTAPENIQIRFQAVVGIHSQLAVDVAVVALHRPHADEQQAGDVLDRIALGIVA